jgi:glycosyltransferase involved in cell wall biosynthesis
LAESGGDFSHLADLGRRLPLVMSLYLEEAPKAELARRLASGEDLQTAVRALINDQHSRVVHYAPLDVRYDPALRVVQIVTSLQRGGAERIALSLAGSLGGYGIHARLVALERPGRETFDAPRGTLDLSSIKGDRIKRLHIAADAAVACGADLVHGHLLDREDMTLLAAQGLPLLMSVHNMRQGWPRGYATLSNTDANLLVACCQAVERDLHQAGVAVPCRTVWNGVDGASFVFSPALLAETRQLRVKFGFGSDDFVLLALANPRPQKQLERLPAILAAIRKELARRSSHREARLIIAGESSRFSQTAAQAEQELQGEIARLKLEKHVYVLGSSPQVAPLLAAADVLVSASAYEGLSLAYLEALAAGVPVVATSVGGTAEIAQDNPTMRLMPSEATADQFAEALLPLAQHQAETQGTALAKDFHVQTMAARYARLYPRAIEAARGCSRGCGILLVINNFVTGGAQSSARRLLTGFAREGIRTRAAVLQEQSNNPTPGRQALVAAGVPVKAMPPAGTIDPAEAVAELLEWIDEEPPEAVLFWNALAEYKILVTDALLDIPVFDVSPGEMFYDSLERYFARPHPGLPYRNGLEYGKRLKAAIVKYRAEAEQAARVLGCPIHVIPNGVLLLASREHNQPKVTNGRLVIGTAARISPQKRLEELLSALNRAHRHLPPYVLRIAGRVERGCGDYAEMLRSLANGLPVEWVGEADDVGPFLQELDLFALASEPAGCPNSSLEAMAAGVPVVGTDVGGVSEQIINGVTGRLVPRGDTAALAEAIVDLAREPEIRTRLGKAGREHVAAHFGVQRMLDDYRRVLFRA